MSDKAEKLFNAMNKIDDGLIGSALDCDGPGKLNNAITNIDDDIIEAALAATPETVKAAPVTAFANRPWVKWVAAAAVFVIVAAAPFAMYKLGVFRSDNLAPPSSSAESDVPEVTPSSESDSGSSEPEGNFASEPDSEAEQTSNSGAKPPRSVYSSQGSANPSEGESGGQISHETPAEPDDNNKTDYPFDPDKIYGSGNFELGAPSGESGVFIKDDMPALMYRINGENKRFNYLNSTIIRKSVGMDLDGNGGYYIVDQYVDAKGDTIMKYEGSEELMCFESENYQSLGNPDDLTLVDNTDMSGIVGTVLAKSAALKTDVTFDGLESASSSVRSSENEYYVTLTVDEGEVDVCVDTVGRLLNLEVKKFAQQLPREKIDIAVNKLLAKLVELKNNDPDGIYFVDSVHYEEWGNAICVVFDVSHYPDKDSDADNVYQYYCVV